MKFSHSRNMNCNFKLFLKSVVFASVVVSINGYPQWVWSKDAIDLGNSGSGIKSSSSDPIRSPLSDSTPYFPKGSVRIINDQTQSRLLFNSITNALPNLGSGGGGGGSSSGGLSGIFGTVLSIVPNFASQAITGVSGLFNRPMKLPGTPGNNVNTDNSSPAATGSCNCVEASGCFLPNKATGSCSGGKVTCCSTSRTLFPDDVDSSKPTRSERTVTQREVRRGLLKNILKGSGSIVDDTLDLFLHPFLSPEDQRQNAQRILGDE